MKLAVLVFNTQRHSPRGVLLFSGAPGTSALRRAGRDPTIDDDPPLRPKEQFRAMGMVGRRNNPSGTVGHGLMDQSPRKNDVLAGSYALTALLKMHFPYSAHQHRAGNEGRWTH